MKKLIVLLLICNSSYAVDLDHRVDVVVGKGYHNTSGQIFMSNYSLSTDTKNPLLDIFYIGAGIGGWFNDGKISISPGNIGIPTSELSGLKRSQNSLIADFLLGIRIENNYIYTSLGFGPAYISYPDGKSTDHFQSMFDAGLGAVRNSIKAGIHIMHISSPFKSGDAGRDWLGFKASITL